MNPKKIKVAIVDDHKLFRDGIMALLNNYEEIGVAFTAENGLRFFEELQQRKRPLDIVLLDLEMPVMDGMAVLKKLRGTYPEIKPLVITRHTEDELIYELASLGARGFLQKSADIEEVVDAIYEVNNEDLYFNEDISKKLIQKIARKDFPKKPPFAVDLTTREIEIIGLICNEYTTKEIAELLFLSERTVDTHKKHILEKTKSKNYAGVVKFAIRSGLIDG